MKRVARESSPLKISKTSIFSFFQAWYDTIFILLSGACGPSTLFHGLRSRCSGRIRSLLQSNARWNYILHLQVDLISSQILEYVLLCKNFVMFLLLSKIILPTNLWNSSVSTRVLKQAAEGSPPHFNSLFRFDFVQVYTIFNASSRNIIGEHSVSFPRTCSNSSPNDSTSILLLVSVAAAVHDGSSHQFWFCQLLHFC